MPIEAIGELHLSHFDCYYKDLRSVIILDESKAN